MLNDHPSGREAVKLSVSVLVSAESLKMAVITVYPSFLRTSFQVLRSTGGWFLSGQAVRSRPPQSSPFHHRQSRSRRRTCLGRRLRSSFGRFPCFGKGRASIFRQMDRSPPTTYLWSAKQPATTGEYA